MNCHISHLSLHLFCAVSFKFYFSQVCWYKENDNTLQVFSIFDKEKCTVKRAKAFLALFACTKTDTLLLADSNLKGELQRQNKLISSERPFKILQNETKIIKIGHAVLEIFNFKD